MDEIPLESYLNAYLEFLAKPKRSAGSSAVAEISTLRTIKENFETRKKEHSTLTLSIKVSELETYAAPVPKASIIRKLGNSLPGKK